MKSVQNTPNDAAKMRRDAEAELSRTVAKAVDPGTDDEKPRLLHELQVHQIELEMQNAELHTSRSEVEELLEKYTDLYDFAPVGYFSLDRNEVIRTANLRGANLLHTERAKLTGRQFGLFVDAEARPRFSAFLGKVFAGEEMKSCEVPLVKQGSSPSFVQIEALAEKSGQECRLAVIDITERRHAQDELDGKRRELEELNRTLGVRIGQAVDDLRSKDRMMILQDRRAIMGEMINNIAHQWRQPLNTLGLIVQLLPIQQELGELNRENLETATGNCMKQIEQMSQTIDGFRNFFRADKEAVLFSVKQLTEQTLTLIEKSFQVQRITVSLRTGGNPTITGYPNEYAQVLLNILMNARDALLTNTIDDARISLHLFEEGNRSVVTISDNAGGVDNKIIDRIFDPYFTTKGPDQGTGIGLFMSKTIIEKNMGGRLTVSNSGEGALFRIEV